MALEAWIGEYPETLSSKTFRSAQPDYPHTLAMHWDGTYRDRVFCPRSGSLYWTDENLIDMHGPAPARVLAKHLA